MDAATLKQKAFIRKLLVQSGVPRSDFHELDFWKLGKEEASRTITELLLLERCYFGKLDEIISENLESKRVLKYVTKTIQELEVEEDENQATYDPTCEDWLDQQAYRDHIPQKDWIQESQADILREQEVVA